MREVEEEGVVVVGAGEPHLLVGEGEQNFLREVFQQNPNLVIAVE